MKSFIILALFCIIFISTVIAADEGFTDYIVALTKPVTKEKLDKAKSDVKKLGGKVNFEITLGMHALAVSLPSNQFQTFQQEDYIDFIEEDKTVHTFK